MRPLALRNVVPGVLLSLLLAACNASDGTSPPASPACTAGEARPKGVVAAGTGSGLALVRALARRYHSALPDRVQVSVPDGIGSGGALAALRDKAIDIGLTSRPLTLAESSAGMEAMPLVVVPLAAVVHTETSAQAVTRAQLADIYAGRMTAWPDGTRIVPLLREAGDSGMRILAEALPAVGAAIAEALAERRWPIAYSDQEALEFVSSTQGAVGFADTGTIRLEGLPLRPLTLDGVEATAANVDSGAYPLRKTISMVTMGEVPSDAAEFLLFCAHGNVADIFERGGYLRRTPGDDDAD